MKKPPLLPLEALRRVLRMAQINGTGILVVSGVFALASASTHDVFGTIIGLLIAGAGAMELHGAGQIRRGEERGMNWMIGCQVYLMAVVFAYVGILLKNMNIDPMRPMVTPELREQIQQAGYTVDRFLRFTYESGCYLVAALTFVYQSAMVLYYGRKRRAVSVALRELES